MLRRYAGRYGSALLALLIASDAFAQDITGDLNTNVGSGATMDSYNNSDSKTINYNGAGSAPGSQPVPTASAPMVTGGGGNDSCLIPDATGVQISILGISRGQMTQDLECNRRKDARLMGTPQATGGLGLQVAGISVMCQNPQVYKAMALSSTPCPIADVVSGKILTGRDAYVRMRDKPEVYIVGYDSDRQFWDTFLLMHLKELPDAPPEPERPSLSDRFRRSLGAGPDDGGPVSSGSSDPEPTDRE